MEHGAPDLDLFGIAWRLGATLFCVALNGFFVGAEFALVKVRRARVERLAKEGKRSALVLKHLVGHLDRYLSACQLGITLASLALGALGEPAVARLLVASAGALGVQISPDQPILTWVSIALAFTVITVLHMTIGEQAPKMWALQRADRTALRSARALQIFTVIFRPLIAVVNGISNALLRLVGLELEDGVESSHTAEEILGILAISARAGHVSPRERELVENIFKMVDLEVRHIMVPRLDVVMLSLQNTLSENLGAIRESGHTRLPLCEAGLDTALGFVHSKDVLVKTIEGKELNLQALARPIAYVPEAQPLARFLLELQNRRTHCAVVVDEHGTATGMAFLEDALEEIVGPVADEFDEEADLFCEVAPGVLEMSGRVALPDALALLDIELAENGHDTIGGQVVAMLDRFPRKGDELGLGPYRVTVIEASRRRVGRLRFERLEVSGDGGA
jgi:CBS domain containing-hemolysin-like protein